MLEGISQELRETENFMVAEEPWDHLTSTPKGCGVEPALWSARGGIEKQLQQETLC